MSTVRIFIILGNNDDVQEICDHCKPEILNISARLDEQQGLNERLEIQVRWRDTGVRSCPSNPICLFCPGISSWSGYFRIFNSYVLHYKWGCCIPVTFRVILISGPVNNRMPKKFKIIRTSIRFVYLFSRRKLWFLFLRWP